MTEHDFATILVELLKPRLIPHLVEAKRSLLYDLSFDHRGVIALGVDPDSGEPLRGRGRGFEQDILVFDQTSDAQTSVIPRVVAEVKYGHINTHDVIVYSEKADRIRRVYPYLRYGFILGGISHIPGRVMRLGQRFDFIATLSGELTLDEKTDFCDLIKEEAATSVALTEMLFGKNRVTKIWRKLVVRK